MFSKIQVEYLLKNYVIFWGGGHQKITLDYRGRGGGPKKDYVIFEWSQKTV